MRIPVLLFCLFAALSVTAGLHAQNPAAQQDAEAAREKLLKAADELDNVQANSEATKGSVDGLKLQLTQMQADLTKVQTENASLKQQLTDLQTAFDAYKTEQVKARQVMIDNVASMLADKSSGTATKTKKKETDEPASPIATKKTEAPSTAPDLAPPPDPSTTAVLASNTETPAPKPQKGYYHVVEKGETLKMICTAYRENGVKVTMAELRKANGLTETSVLKPGQKLFIPKPGI